MLNYHITIISSDELPKSSATRYYRYIMKTEDRDVCNAPFKMSSVGEALSPNTSYLEIQFTNVLLYRMFTRNGNIFT